MASVPVSSRRNQLLEWFPFYVHRLVGDVRYRALKDYQQAWYLNLLFVAIVEPTFFNLGCNFQILIFASTGQGKLEFAPPSKETVKSKC
jgi:hypothetical protein